MKPEANPNDGLSFLPVFYTPNMVANFSSYSPSAAKPARVVETWQKLNLPIKIIAPQPVSVNDFTLVHSTDYVDRIMACKIANGFGNYYPEVAQSLPYTTGAMLAAAREAIRNGIVAVAPCSGFHHAGYASPHGYCTFNGLMVTAFVLKTERLVNKVGILDFDMHYGDGTDELIEHHNAANWIIHFTAGKEYKTENQAHEFLERIPQWISYMRDCDVILYQAGADPHIDDPLGGFLTREQLKERDKRVFTIAKELGIPIAWNLAGGYQIDNHGGIQAILDIHNNTMQVCIEVYTSDDSACRDAKS